MFIYSLPLIFTYTDLGSPLELLIIMLTLGIVLYISAPIPNSDVEDKSFNYPLYQYFIYAWTAQLPLWRIFWPYFISFNLGIYAADVAVRTGILSVSSWDSAHFVFVVPGWFWLVSVWRNSENATKKIYSTSARLMTIAVIFEYILKLYLRIESPRILFNCEDRILDYLICF